MTLRLSGMLPALLIGLVLIGSGSNVSPALAAVQSEIDRVTRSIEQHPDNADLYARRAHFYRELGQLEEALADLEKARSIEPGNMAVALGLGLTLSAMGRDGEAEAELNRFLSTGERSMHAYSERAAIRARTGRTLEAIKDYSRAIEIGRDVGLYLRRGALQEELGDLDAAAKGYLDGFENLGEAVLLRLVLIRVETDRGNYDAALAYIEPELQRVRVKTSWYLRKAEVLQAAGRNDEAEQTLNLALHEANQVMQKRATSIHQLSRAKVYAAMGRTEEAIEDLKYVLAKSPRFSEAQELLVQLEAKGTSQGD